MTRIRKVTIAVLVLYTQLLMASSSRNFPDPADKVFAACVASANARGYVVSSDEKAGVINFYTNVAPGTITVSGSEKGTTVTVEVKGNVKWLTDFEGPILSGAEKFLKGKSLKTYGLLRSHAIEAASRQQYSFSSPASVVIHSDVKRVKGALISQLAQKGFAVSGETDSTINLFRDVSADRPLAGFLLFGNSLPSAYRYILQFIFVQEADNVRVLTATRMITQNGYGGTVQSDLNSDPDSQAVMQTLLNQIKSGIERDQSNQPVFGKDVPPPDKIPGRP